MGQRLFRRLIAAGIAMALTIGPATTQENDMDKVKAALAEVVAAKDAEAEATQVAALRQAMHQAGVSFRVEIAGEDGARTNFATHSTDKIAETLVLTVNSSSGPWISEPFTAKDAGNFRRLYLE